MPIRVNLPDGSVVNFPDSMTPDQVQSAMRRLTQGKAADPVVRPEDKPYGWREQMPLASAAVDALQGARAGLLRTAFKGGDLIRRGLGMERVIDTPEAQAAMTPPQSLAGKVGFYGEQIGEFAVPLSKVTAAVKGAPMAARMLAEGAAAAGVGAVQSGGDPNAAIVAGTLGAMAPSVGAVVRTGGRVLQRAAAGAKESGVGGALASAVRTVAPAEPKAMMVQALKPRALRVNFPAALDRALPEIKAAEQQIGKPVESIDGLIEATQQAKRNVQGQLNQLRGPQHAMGAEVDLSPVADAMTKSIPSKVKIENPALANRMVATANVYRRNFTLEESERLLQETNAELEGFYAQYPQAQRKALISNPSVAALESQAKALRDAIYAKLDAPGQGAAARELNRRYGSLMEVEHEAMRRANVAKRQQPESLSEQIGAVRAAGEMARGTWRLMHGDLSGAADIAAGGAMRSTAKAIKDSQTTDALIRRAMAGYKGRSVPVTMPLPTQIRGLLEPGARRMGPAPDASFVRGVPAVAQPANPRRLLPEAQAPRVVRPMPGEVQPDPSGGGSVPSAPIDYAVDPTRQVKAGGFKVKQYSSDPQAAKAAVANPEVRSMLNHMLQDLKTFTPQRGRLINDPNDPGFSIYARGVAGSPVGDDIRVISEQNVGNAQIVRAIKDLLAGKTPTNRLHTAALDAAEGYLERREGYRGPVMPSWAVEEDDGFAAFSRAVDELSDR